MRYVLKIAYDGTAYAGWQRQKNALSVQQVLEECILNTLGRDVRITASGRTDAGVHAAGQVCHFDDDVITVPAERLPDCLNRFLPADVRVLKGWAATDGFDSNRSAKRKTYAYTMYEATREMPLLERYAVRVENVADLPTLQSKAKLFEGEHDFKAFCASGSSVKTTVRTVYEVNVEEEFVFGVRQLRVFVTGNGFLYNMVRIIAGTLLAVGEGTLSTSAFEQAFQGKKRTILGKTAPAAGLTLLSVVYEIK